MFTSTARTLSFTNDCVVSTLQWITSQTMSQMRKEREGKRRENSLEKSAQISHSSLRWNILYLHCFTVNRSTAQYYSERFCVKSEILFLETVPVRYYLLAVFQKKHRRHHRKRAQLLSGCTVSPLWTFCYRCCTQLPAPCSIEIKKKRREIIGRDKKRRGSLWVTRN
jgi:hypothetical protein